MNATVPVETLRRDAWLQAGYPQAVQLLGQQVKRAEAMNALRYYFLRKAVALNGGRLTHAALSVGAHRNTVYRAMRFSNARMQPAARVLAENWATWLACQGASLADAEAVFSRALVKGAIDICNDNQCKAARILGIHRNTVQRIAAAAGAHGLQAEGRA